MVLIAFLQLFLYTFLITVKGDETTTIKKFNPNFRHQVEEIEEKPVSEKSDKDDSERGNLVSFLLQNVKEIFNEANDQSEATTSEITTIVTSNTIKLERTTYQNITPTHSSMQTLPTSTVTTFADVFTSEIITPTTTDTITTITTSSIMPPTHTKEIVYENLSLTSLLDDELPTTYGYDTTKLIINLNDVRNVGKTEKKEREIHISSPIRNYIGNASDHDGDHDPRRSCILCNNVASEDCNDPKNKLITSVTCERDDDMCYSMHTPFGIIDRGCFNTNHNLTIYVCSCNLCNYLSISEMPFAFDNKRGWSENVIEISRTRHFRKSVFKEMSCLKCEVNTTRDKGDALDTANCLEGNIGSIPVEDCDPSEICAVKALRADGYIWRGCLKAPLYNYWWSLCDYDLCNYDPIISLYDVL